MTDIQRIHARVVRRAAFLGAGSDRVWRSDYSTRSTPRGARHDNSMYLPIDSVFGREESRLLSGVSRSTIALGGTETIFSFSMLCRGSCGTALIYQQVGHGDVSKDIKRISCGSDTAKYLFCFDEWAVTQETVEFAKLSVLLVQFFVLGLEGVGAGCVGGDVVLTRLVTSGTWQACRSFAVTLQRLISWGRLL